MKVSSRRLLSGLLLSAILLLCPKIAICQTTNAIAADSLLSEIAFDVYKKHHISFLELTDEVTSKEICGYYIKNKKRVGKIDKLLLQLYLGGHSNIVNSPFAAAGIFKATFAFRLSKRHNELLYVFSPSNSEVKIYRNGEFYISRMYITNDVLETLINRLTTN